MKRLVAIATVGLGLLVAPVAGAAHGDHYGIADVTGPDAVAAPAFPNPAGKALWAGTCDLAAASAAVGVPPASFAHCIAQEASGILPPLAPGVTPGTSGPAGWQGTLPSWRLAPVSQAGAHPDATASFWFVRAPNISATFSGSPQPDGDTKNIAGHLPPGVVGNPRALALCPAGPNLRTVPVACPPQSQVGVSTINFGSHGTAVFPVYNVEPRDGKTAEFILSAGIGSYATNVPIVARARSEGDFGIDTTVIQIPTGFPIVGQTFTFWGVPWAAVHDRYRVPEGFAGTEIDVTGGRLLGMPVGGLSGAPDQNGNPAAPVSYDPSWGPIRPFFINPSECAPDAPVTTFDFESWHRPGEVFDYSIPADAPLSDCADVPFDPEISLDPTGSGGAAVHGADTPTGLDVALDVPQNNDLPFAAPPDGSAQGVVDSYISAATAYWKSAAGLATAHLRDTAVTLPAGMTLNPAAADGQDVCTMEQMGVTDVDSPEPPAIRFDNSPIECPDSSKVGEVVVETPLLEPADWPEGSVYLAAQGDNPFNSDFAIYIVIASPDRNLLVKLAGKVEPDPNTGRLTTTFADNPRLPFDTFSLKFKGGPRAPLATPVTCGTHTSVSDFTPWTAAHGAGGTTDTVPDPFDLTSSPAGGCPATKGERPFGIGFSTGSTEIVAGAHSPFTVRLTRPDGNQEFDRVEVTTPEGLAARLAGVPYCSEAGIAQAIARTATGDGALEQSSSSCPATSQVGTTTVGAGAGSQPFYVRGNVYLAGPYRGAPVSLAFIVPAVAGPFDLGVQVVRAALNINSRTAQATTVSDSIPQILRGVPLRVRDIRVDIDRPGFILNPTDCSEQLVTGKVFGASGAVSNVSNRFQVANCANLPFKPKLTLRLRGGTKRGRYPQLTATVLPRPGDANIASVSVAFPRSEFLANEHIRTVCTRPDFAADNCPAGAIYGESTVTTPLLDFPLTGHVYLRSSDNLLPDLVPDLRGPAQQPIKVEAAGRTDSIRGGIRTTFDYFPDAPFTRAVVRMQGGNKGLLVNSRDICRRTYRATVAFTAQNGRTYTFQPKMRAQCGRARKGKRSKRG